jgi:hypothetical protein
MRLLRKEALNPVVKVLASLKSISVKFYIEKLKRNFSILD